ncbi:MAG: Ldh family oxidoreductase [Pseudomonadota bacterium]
MSQIRMSLDELRQLIVEIFLARDCSPTVAGSIAAALVRAEADGQKGHGASRVPSYAAQAASGKADGRAVPELTRLGPSAALVDAKDGFAYPALIMAQGVLKKMLVETPVAAVSIRNSHHSGVVAHHVEPLAEAGFVAISMGNTPHAIAPWGGTKGVFGTNPIGFAAPRDGRAPLVIDMSLSKVARGKINVAAQAGTDIEDGWAFDADGNPTTDAKAALGGSLAPMGDAKGAQLVLMVEILAAALSASCFGFEAASFFDAEGPAPRVGALLIGVDPGPLSSGAFGDRLETLIREILAQPGTRLPGERRRTAREAAERDGVTLPEALHQQLLSLR